MQQLQALAEEADPYGKGVRVEFDDSVEDAQLARRMTSQLSGRSFDSQFGWACDVAGLAYEWIEYGEDRLNLRIRSRVAADGAPTPFQLGKEEPSELVIHEGDNLKGLFIEIPSEAEGTVSVWVDYRKVATLKPGSVASTKTGKRIDLRPDGTAPCVGRYRFYQWMVKVSP